MLTANQFNFIYSNSALSSEDKQQCAHQHAIKTVKELHNEREKIIRHRAVEMNGTASKKLSLFCSSLYKEAFEIVAKSIGFDGVHSDINTFVSTPSPSDKVNPLISFSDLHHALISESQEKGDLELKRLFYTVAMNETDEVKQAVAAALNSLDLRSPSMDAHFFHLLETVPEFKQHAIRTIAASNRELAKAHGLSEIKLTKKHVYSYKDQDICSMDTTPLFHLKQEIANNHAKNNQQYALYSSVLDAQYQLAVAELNSIFVHSPNTELSKARAFLQNSMDKAKKANALDGLDEALQSDLDKVFANAKLLMQDLPLPKEKKRTINATLFKPIQIRPSIPTVKSEKLPESPEHALAPIDNNADNFDELSQEMQKLMLRENKRINNRFFNFPLATIIEVEENEVEIKPSK